MRPTQFYAELRPTSPPAMIKADTPTLWEIRSHSGHAVTVAILVTALIHLSRLVNLPEGSNLNNDQIGEIANDVIEDYGYLKPEEVKYVLKQAVRQNKIYGRLDYSVVISWFKDYDAMRTEHCIDISNQEETQAANRIAEDSEAASFEDYLLRLRFRAANGDETAKNLLADIENPSEPKMKLLTAEEKHQKELDFFKWKIEYNKRKNERI